MILLNECYKIFLPFSRVMHLETIFFTQSVSASHNVAINGTFTFAIFFKKLLMIARNSLSAPSNIFYAMFYKAVDA